MVRGIQIMQQFWILTFPRAVSAHNARADTYGREILKCSKWPGSYSKLFIGDFEHFKILTRAHVRGFESPDMNRPICWHMAWSLWALNMVDLEWMVMKIWMITWNHKMAPGWRHGWVIRLKSLYWRFLIRAKILWKFENDSHRNFWDNRGTKFYRNKGKIIKIRTDTIGDMPLCGISPN